MPPGSAKVCSRGRDVDHVAHGGVFGGTGHVPDDDLAGVDTDAQLQRTVEVGLLGDETGERVVHLQRRPDGPIGIILVGDRRAEQREDAVTEDFVDTAAEAGDVGDQALEAGVDQALHPLGVEVLGQCGVADQIGEHDRDDTTLFGSGRRHLVPARGAEACSVGKRGVTRRASGHQPVIVRHVHPRADHRTDANG